MMTCDARFAGDDPPCSSPIVDKSFLVTVLPFMNLAPLYDSINQDLTILGRENRTAQAVTIDTYSCPSDPASRQPREGDVDVMLRYGLASADETLMMGFTSYSGCVGSFQVDAMPRPSTGCVVPSPLAAQANGCFHDLSPIRLASIRDGLSNTILVVEKATETFRELDAVEPASSKRYGWYFTGNWGDTLATTFFPPNMIMKVSLVAGPSHTRAASSLHPRGVNVLMGDGSVRFIKDTIQTWEFSPVTGQPLGTNRHPGGWWEGHPRPGIWQDLATRAGGEVIDAGGL